MVERLSLSQKGGRSSRSEASIVRREKWLIRSPVTRETIGSIPIRTAKWTRSSEAEQPTVNRQADVS